MKEKLYLPVRHAETTHLVVSTYYSKAPMSYGSGGMQPRGYYVSVYPVTRKDGLETTTLFHGLKRLLERTERLSGKRLEALMAESAAQVGARVGPVWDVVAKVAAKEGLELIEEGGGNA